LGQLYCEAIGAIDSGRPSIAKPALSRILATDPDYKDAAELLVHAKKEAQYGLTNSTPSHQSSYNAVQGLAKNIGELGKQSGLTIFRRRNKGRKKTTVTRSRSRSRGRTNRNTTGITDRNFYLEFQSWQKKETQRTWLASTLSWLPLLYPLLRLVAINHNRLVSSYVVICSICCIIGWLISGIYGANRKGGPMLIIASAIGLLVAYFSSSVLDVNGVIIYAVLTLVWGLSYSFLGLSLCYESIIFDEEPLPLNVGASITVICNSLGVGTCIGFCANSTCPMLMFHGYSSINLLIHFAVIMGMGLGSSALFFWVANVDDSNNLHWLPVWLVSIVFSIIIIVTCFINQVWMKEQNLSWPSLVTFPIITYLICMVTAYGEILRLPPPPGKGTLQHE